MVRHDQHVRTGKGLAGRPRSLHNSQGPSVRWAQVIFAVDPDPSKAGLIKAWAVDYSEAVHPYAASGGGAYVNFIQEESQDRVRASYRDNYERLAQVNDVRPGQRVPRQLEHRARKVTLDRPR